MLKDRTAIVTGAGRGLGKAIALTLAREGADVAVWGRTLEKVQNTAREIEALGRKALAMKVDVSDSAQVNEGIQQVLEKWQKIDIFVNNAAVLSGLTRAPDPSKLNPFLDMTDEQWAEQIDTDLTGVFYCIRAVSRPMMERRYGKIINIGSLAGVNGGYFTSPAYSASKGGVINMSRMAARWLGKYGINVNVVNPGPVKTEGADFAPAQMEALIRTIPFRRGGVETDALGTPQDIANAVLFLASELSSYITGLCVNVFGGQHMG